MEAQAIDDRVHEKAPFFHSSAFKSFVVVVLIFIVVIVLCFFAFRSSESFSKTGYSERTSTGEDSGVVSSVQHSYVPYELFKAHDEKYSEQIQNSSKTNHVIKYTGKTCLEKHKEVVFGLELKNEFLPCLYCCYDAIEQNTKYCVAAATKTNDKKSTSRRPGFSQGKFYNVDKTNVNKQYTKNVQRKTINASVGLPLDSTQYIKNSSGDYFARGHLTENANFVHDSQRRLTFHYVNVAPQHQTFNNTIWKKLEKGVRDYARVKDKNLLVYTGTHGIMTLPHEETGQDTKLFLYVKDEDRAIPIPHLFWKVVYEHETKAGIAFVCVNNPFYKDLLKDDGICNDISKETDWYAFNRIESGLGNYYACHVNDFAKVVPLPPFETTSLLA